jgi:FAD/FMN-containing dehydrogenase
MSIISNFVIQYKNDLLKKEAGAFAAIESAHARLDAACTKFGGHLSYEEEIFALKALFPSKTQEQLDALLAILAEIQNIEQICATEAEKLIAGK